MNKFPEPNPKKRPITENVDYFQYDFDLLDLHSCWKRATHTGKNKNYHIAVQGKRRENATWRRFFQESHKLRKLNPKVLDWSKDRDKHWFYGPFYPNETCKNYSCAVGSLQSLVVPQTNSNLKPAIKRKLHPKDYIRNIKPETPLRRSYSDSALADHRLTSSVVKDLQQSPSTPKEIVIKFFEEDKGQTSPQLFVAKRINFNPFVEERVFDSNSDTPISPVKSEETVDSCIDNQNTGADNISNVTFTTNVCRILPVLSKGHSVGKFIPRKDLESISKAEMVIPDECKKYFRCPNEHISNYLANWQKDVNYHTDADYLDYPPEEISDEITEDIVLPTFDEVDDRYGITDYISDSIVCRYGNRGCDANFA